jgi:hypothetical protein
MARIIPLQNVFLPGEQPFHRETHPGPMTIPISFGENQHISPAALWSNMPLVQHRMPAALRHIEQVSRPVHPDPFNDKSPDEYAMDSLVLIDRKTKRHSFDLAIR